MEINQEHIDDLIAKFLSGEITPAESAALEKWKNNNQENQQYFDKSKRLFEQIESLRTEQQLDIDRAWKKLEQKLEAEKVRVVPLKKPIFTLYRAAAALAVLALLSVVLVWALNGNKTETLALSASKNPGLNKLPDGSTVFLNKNTELVFEKGKNKREVRLKGEAFFEVIHDEKQPFVVKVNDAILIKDIGTAFNVKAKEGDDKVEVFVESGEVQFYTAEDKGILLVKGDKGTYSLSKKMFVKSSITELENTAAYKTKIFNFKDTPLSSVITQLNDVYDLDIMLDNEALGNCRLSVMFNNETPEAILNIITETLNLQSVRTGNKIVLSGEPCN